MIAQGGSGGIEDRALIEGVTAAPRGARPVALGDVERDRGDAGHLQNIVDEP